MINPLIARELREDLERWVDNVQNTKHTIDEDIATLLSQLYAPAPPLIEAGILRHSEPEALLLSTKVDEEVLPSNADPMTKEDLLSALKESKGPDSSAVEGFLKTVWCVDHHNVTCHSLWE